MDEKLRIEQLRKELHEHNYRYYVLNQPTIGDQDFDFMMKELQDLEAKHPELYDANSPSQRVGSDLQSGFQQVTHRYPMLSLANTYSEADVRDWYESVKKGLAGEDFEVCCEMKYDGLSISLTYVKGRLTQAVTRGDGVHGDDGYMVFDGPHHDALHKVAAADAGKLVENERMVAHNEVAPFADGLVKHVFGNVKTQ